MDAHLTERGWQYILGGANLQKEVAASQKLCENVMLSETNQHASLTLWSLRIDTDTFPPKLNLCHWKYCVC